MKLAEALQERADINRNIEQLKNRLSNNVLVQEGEKTAEDPGKLKQELDASIERLAHLISCINATNCAARVNGQTLTELIAKKDALSLKISIYKDVAYAGSQTSYRARNTEIKIKPTIAVKDWQAEIDRMAKELRLLDNTLQQSNWNTELMEA
ncbi:MAG: DIP1984 family protein [Lachnospiraceae bacterium]|nr:DIP1984 family protein [Lachnospiraceae bacterium]